MYQQITVIGHIGRDPESKQSKNGKQYAQISVAVSRSLGQGAKETTWFAVTVWENQAAYIVNYAKKGSLIMAIGRLVPDPQNGGPRIWIDNNNQPRANFEVMAHEIKIISGFKSEEERNQTPGVTPRQSYSDHPEYY